MKKTEEIVLLGGPTDIMDGDYETIGFTGHRDAPSPDMIVVQALLERFPAATIIHGGADGFDKKVDNLARLMGFEPVIVRPQYKKFHPKSAPILRNKVIVQMSDLLVACLDRFRGYGGTFRTVEYAKSRGVKVLYVEPGGYGKAVE